MGTIKIYVYSLQKLGASPSGRKISYFGQVAMELLASKMKKMDVSANKKG